jgi:DNA-binding response OmpR family regulator
MVFVVDVDEVFLCVALEALSGLGELFVFADARAALDAAERPDLVVSEIVLGEPGGFGLLARLARRHGEDAPRFLFVSSLRDDDTHTQCLEAGADDYLAKPVSVAVLRARAAALLRRSGRMERSGPSDVLSSSVPINSHALRIETRIKSEPPHLVSTVRAGERELVRRALPLAEGLPRPEVEALQRRLHEEVESTMRDRVSLLRRDRLRGPTRAPLDADRAQQLLDEGVEHALSGRWAPALAAWEAGLAIDPEHSALRVNVEVARRKLGPPR